MIRHTRRRMSHSPRSTSRPAPSGKPIPTAGFSKGLAAQTHLNHGHDPGCEMATARSPANLNRPPPRPGAMPPRLGLVLLLAVLVTGAVAVSFLWPFYHGGDRGGRPIGATSETVTAASPVPGYFEDVTPGSGLAFTHRNGEEAGHATILESLGGGVALLDYDGDFLLDVFLTGGGYFDGPDKKVIKGHSCKLYKNLGGFKFKDVTAEVGLDSLADGEPWFYTHGCAVADYDNDGWPDLLVTGYGRLALCHNVPDGKGGRRFEEVTRQAGLTDSLWSTSAAWADLDGDGLPDLYVCHYVNWSWENNPPCKDFRDQKLPDVCSPKVFLGLPDALYHNNGDGTFTEVSAEAGLRVPRPDAAYARLTHLSHEAREWLRRADREKDYGKGLGVLIADLDDDGRPDIYVANDTSGNFLYLNRGGGRFEEVAHERG